jgi:Acetyltransferase (GNAT) domain
MQSLETPRLHLIPLRQSDASELFVIRGDPQAMEYWDGPPDRDLAQTSEIVSGLLGEVASGRALYWTIRQNRVHGGI